MEPIGGAKKKKKEKSRKSEFIQIRIPVAKAGSKKYTHVDWNELLRDNGKQRDEEELRRFYDEDTLFMAKKLRETKSKSGKKIRVNLDEIQHMNRNCGYDMDDDFIDDTEAVDDTNFVSKKGGFYAGKGNVKDLQDLIEEEEESEDDDDVIVPEVSKPKKKKMKEKNQMTSTTATSSDSEPEVVRMTGAPPTARMTGAPPSKRFRPSPPTKEPTPPPGIKAIDSPVVVKKKAPPPAPEVILSSTSSTSSDIICLDDEPPVKKKAPEVPTSSSEVNGVAKNQNSTTTTTMAVKKKPQDETINNKKPSAVPSSSKAPPSPTTPSKPDASVLTLSSSSSASSSSSSQSKPTTSQPTTSSKTLEITSLFEKISKTGKLYKEKNLKTFDPETLSDITRVMESIKSLKKEKIDMGPVITTIANSFGMTTAEVTKQVERGAATIQKKPAESLEKPKKSISREPEVDWKLSKTDLPHMEEPDISMMTTIVGSWRNKKQLTNSMISAWLKEVREKKMNTDDARVSFYGAINKLPDVDDSTPQDNGLELPKHERSRKPRMFLHQWVYLSRKYVEMTLPALKKITTEGLALKQLTAVNALKEGLKKQVSKYESAKAKEPTKEPFQFSYTEPILAAVAPYLEEMTDYALSTRRLDTVVTAIDSLHPPISEHVTLIQFYIEICRRLQKLSFLVVEEPMKKRLSDANEQIGKHQVVQTPKYQVKWPNGEEPSLRGLNRELHVYDKSILEICGKSPPSNRSSISSKSSNPLTSSITPSRPSTSVSKPSTSSVPVPSTTAPSTSSAPSKIQNPSDDVTKRQQAMNQLVQVYLGKYILATGNSSTAEITDSKQFPLSDEILLLLTIAVYSSGVPLPNQMVMFKNLMQNVGQARLANAVAMHKTRSSQKLTEKDHQKLFDFFGSLDKKLEQNKQEKINKIQEENQRKIEEKQRKEQEKQAEKERIEARKKEEKERKEREKREEKERKEREIRENFERRRREEEDRIKARRELEQELEDKRRKKEAEEAVEKELERRAKLETEAANALQGLEEDLLLDDIDFVTEQQSKVDEERKIAEAKRAEERENQIKMMRAQQIQRRREDTPEVVMPSVVQPEIVQPSSSSTNPSLHTPVVVKKECFEPPVDILNAAQEAADIPIIESNNIVKQEPTAPEKPMSAFEKLASLRGRTMSADMKRGGDVMGTQMGHPTTNGTQNVLGAQGAQHPMGVIQNSPYLASQSSTQQFFPTSSTQPLQHFDPPVAIHQNSQNSQFSNQSFNSAPIPPMHQPVPRLQHQNPPPQNPQLNQQAQMHLQQQQQRLQYQNPNSMSSGAIFQGNGAEQREPNRRSMSMSQSQSSFPQHQSPQQFPINSYQSPIHQNSSMSNSSLMHTPHSNNSMISQSPQFSSHPSPMSQQFHTPPSVGMLTHMNPSPMAQPNPSPLQHFNFPPTASSNYSPQRVAPQQQQQMHRQLSQQNLMMMQQQHPNNQHPMMHQNQLNHHNYPPQ